ncbi:UBA/THIF-type NAD/FAD binding fold [Shewanella denitrificans OS217]|jgi:sulfur carrier protein ThiS adenylyltransferase|uniref:UBA/THIF-type NAD/FAD binding fold n=1 Tax=Shewanella denitrificans (strain OS217 / ATCC BAA-1090 / DSM 15013) TaxID=318161 RepID=Q12NC0_SHEDO|nr:HesA/MoeB/ThiF family protein [Shewanella denitrificans]ABE55056.1 UBA/THIF-type NAD/FAD binding fold [Shewanella denitrificans OS217]
MHPKSKTATRELTDRQFIRYSRQIMLSEVDEAGQINLLNAKVFVVGMGGLGQQLVQLLAAAGVGTVLFMDFDKVELSNLPRQLLYDAHDIGKYKVNAALSKLETAYPDSHFIAVNDYFDECFFNTGHGGNKLEVLLGAMPDLVFDCTDNFIARHKINDLCVHHSLVLISAAVANFNGQLFSYIPKPNIPKKSSSNPSVNKSAANFRDTENSAPACYHCLYPRDTQIEQSCSHTGVLGPAVATLAAMQAMMGLNVLLSNSPQGGVLHKFDAKKLSWSRYGLSQDPSCPVCASRIDDNRASLAV